MYDNIDMTLSKDQSPDVDFLKNIPQFLTNVSNEGINQFGEYVTGHLDSLKVSISDNRVKVHDSSLCKYLLGDNFKTLTRGDTQRAMPGPSQDPISM